MRNVNKFLSTGKSKVAAFYINYEECKWKAMLFIQMRELSFILTMRNVNLIKSALYLKALSVLY